MIRCSGFTSFCEALSVQRKVERSVESCTASDANALRIRVSDWCQTSEGVVAATSICRANNCILNRLGQRVGGWILDLREVPQVGPFGQIVTALRCNGYMSAFLLHSL